MLLIPSWFIISYDGDETTVKDVTEPQIQLEPQQESVPEHPKSTAFAEHNLTIIEEKQEAPADPEGAASDSDKHAYANGNSGAPAWVEGLNSERHVSNYGDVGPEEESRGIGIKEDG